MKIKSTFGLLFIYVFFTALAFGKPVPKYEGYFELSDSPFQIEESYMGNSTYGTFYLNYDDEEFTSVEMRITHPMQGIWLYHSSRAEMIKMRDFDGSEVINVIFKLRDLFQPWTFVLLAKEVQTFGDQKFYEGDFYQIGKPTFRWIDPREIPEALPSALPWKKIGTFKMNEVLDLAHQPLPVPR